MENEPTQKEKINIKKPIYKKWYFWVIIAVVVLIVIGAVLGSTNANNDTQEDEDSNKNQTVYYIGESVTIGSFEYTINGVYNTKTINTSSGLKSTENNYIRIDITAKNVDDKQRYLSTFGMKLLLDKKEYSWSFITSDLDTFVASGISRTFWLVFETPSESTEDDYFLQVGSNNSQIISLKEKGID